MSATKLLVTLVIILGVILTLRLLGIPESPPPPPPPPPPKPTLEFGFRDEFTGTLLWEKAVGKPGPGTPQPPRVSGHVTIEDGELHISADAWWYYVFAVRYFPEVSHDIEAFMKFKIMFDSADSTNVRLSLGTGDVTNPAQRTVGFCYDGYYKRWSIDMWGREVARIPTVVAKGTWTEIGIIKKGNVYRFLVNGKQIYECNVEGTFRINYIALGTFVGIHWEGGTHVHFDSVWMKQLK